MTFSFALQSFVLIKYSWTKFSFVKEQLFVEKYFGVYVSQELNC